MLLHVVDTPVTRVHGDLTADRETGGDARYLAELVVTLQSRGHKARSVLLYGPDPAGQLVAHLRSDPVDLLVVGSHGHGLVRDLLFGQTVDRVRHHLEIPMLITRPGRGSTPAPEAATPTADGAAVRDSLITPGGSSASNGAMIG
jgi:manganese transport protein